MSGELVVLMAVGLLAAMWSVAAAVTQAGKRRDAAQAARLPRRYGMGSMGLDDVHWVVREQQRTTESEQWLG